MIKQNFLNKDADYFIISDAHVGSHSVNDCCNYKKLIPFLKDVLENTKATLILNGDFFEYMKFFKSNVIKKNKKIYTLLENFKKQNRLIYLKGNHDYSASNIKQYIINNSILILHGDIFEKSTNNFFWLNYFIHIMVSIIEKILRKNINCLLKKIFNYDRMKKRGEKIEKKALNYIKQLKGINTIIVGHTHTPGFNHNYYNCGSFTDNNSDYIEITKNQIFLKKY